MLEVLLKAKELRDAKAELEKAQAEKAELDKREAELEKDIEKAESDEQRAAVESGIAEFKQDRSDNDEKISKLDTRVQELTNEIAEMEKEQETEPAKDNEQDEQREDEHKHVERSTYGMRTRDAFKGAQLREIESMLEDEKVKDFLTEIRSAMKEQRAISNANLLIPEVLVGFIRENIMEYSKLYKHVFVRQVKGNAREIVEGGIPEAVWTDCCANVNELELGFNEAEVYCWNVGGYMPVCKSTIQDADIDLAAEIITVLGAAIGLALDKAIVFGPGTRMPQGVFTRLAQTSKPADYPATERAWADLHTSNIKTITAANSTGIKLYQEIIKAAAAAKGKYSRGEKVWVMNETTMTTLQAEGLSINAAGAIVSGVNGTMPVAGGVIEVLDFIPDNVIIAGYFDLYLLAEREGVSFEESDHVMFLNRKRVYMANARYDGKPVIAEGFVAIGINNTTPSAASITFAPDTANATPSN